MYQRILVPVDGSDTSKRGLEEAVRLAKLTHGRLRVIHVIDDLSFSAVMGAHTGFMGNWSTYLRESGEALVAEAKAVARAAGIEVDGAVHDELNCRLYEVVASEARSWAADLIVLGTQGRRGVGRLILGSGAESILRTSSVPVLLVRAPEGDPFRP
ncbi:MAG TPA: universal stress protein [Variovorax sp.]|jgi:nucleotide-binding universal stress UspA family protein